MVVFCGRGFQEEPNMCWLAPPLLHPFPDRGDQRLFIGELTRLQLRVQQFPIHGQLETPAGARDELELGDLLLVFFEQLLRQTDGLRFVASHRAIFEFQVRGCLLEWNEKLSPFDLKCPERCGSQGQKHSPWE